MNPKKELKRLYTRKKKGSGLEPLFGFIHLSSFPNGSYSCRRYTEAAQRVKDKASQKQEQRRRVAHLLKNQLELMLGMGLSKLPDLTEELPTRQCKKGSIITSQGEHSDVVWFIKRGSAKSVYVLPGSSVEDAIELSFKKEGDFIGELAIMLDKPNRLVTSVATSPCELVGIRKHLFLQLVGTNASLRAKMMQRALEVKREREEIINAKLKMLGLRTLQSIRVTKTFKVLHQKSTAASEA